MKYMRIVIIPLLLITISTPTWAARRLVDNFNGPTIDFTKWSDVFDSTMLSADEFEGRIDTAAGNLVMKNASDGSSFQRFRTNVLSTTLDALQATVSVISVNAGGSKAAANVEGLYYNSSSPAPVDEVGDVFATVSIGDRGNGLEAWWEILESTHSDFETWNETTGPVIAPGTLSTNTPYVAKIEYDGNRSFTFTVDGMSSGPIQGPMWMGATIFPLQRLSAMTRCCGTNPSIHATFDDVVLDNALTIYDDFSTGLHIDSTKWVQHGGTRSAENGKLLLYVDDDDIGQTDRVTTVLYLKERNPDYMEARISISSTSVLDPGLQGRARLTGVFYNERRDGGVNALPYDGADGDVFGRVRLLLLNGGLSAQAYLESELANFDTDQILFRQNFIKPIALDTEYLVSIKRDGKRLIFGLDDEKLVYNITTPTYPPSPFGGNGYRNLQSRIQGRFNPADASGLFRMLVDDVYIENFPSSEDDDNGGGGGGCFIATAAYGSYLDPHVKTLRRFRDQYLLTNSPGEWFVEYYYQHSPPIANYIREREMLRTMVRSLLTVFVYSIEYPVAAFLVALLPPLIVARKRKRRKNRTL